MLYIQLNEAERQKILKKQNFWQQAKRTKTVTACPTPGAKSGINFCIHGTQPRDRLGQIDHWFLTPSQPWRSGRMSGTGLTSTGTEIRTKASKKRSRVCVRACVCARTSAIFDLFHEYSLKTIRDGEHERDRVLSKISQAHRQEAKVIPSLTFRPAQCFFVLSAKTNSFPAILSKTD